MEVTGPQQDLERFVSGLIKSEGSFRLIESYYPCPEELREVEHGWSSDDAVQAEREKKYEANLAKYGAKSWYDWQYKHWGTKWGDCETMMNSSPVYTDGQGSVDFWYQSAWGTLTEAWVHISQQFPTLTFDFYHDEEAGFFEGYEVIRNGKVIAEAMYEPCEYPGEVDWDDEKSMEKYDKWREKMLDACDAKKQALLSI
jgi:hypothetical protein